MAGNTPTPKYRTKQREAIRSYLQEHPGQHFTIKEIAAHFIAQDQAIGTATIYRCLDQLIEEGAVRKYINDGQMGACFEYVDAEQPLPQTFHLKCDACGQLLHFRCEALNDSFRHLLSAHSLKINAEKTMLYGLCDECLLKE